MTTLSVFYRRVCIFKPIILTKITAIFFVFQENDFVSIRPALSETQIIGCLNFSYRFRGSDAPIALCIYHIEYFTDRHIQCIPRVPGVYASAIHHVFLGGLWTHSTSSSPASVAAAPVSGRGVWTATEPKVARGYKCLRPICVWFCAQRLYPPPPPLSLSLSLFLSLTIFSLPTSLIIRLKPKFSICRLLSVSLFFRSFKSNGLDLWLISSPLDIYRVTLFVRYHMESVYLYLLEQIYGGVRKPGITRSPNFFILTSEQS